MGHRKIRIDDFKMRFDIETRCRLLASRGELSSTIAYDDFSDLEMEIRQPTPGIEDFAPTAQEFIASYTRLFRFFQLPGSTLSQLRKHERDAVRPIVIRLSESQVWKEIAKQMEDKNG